MSAVAGTDWQEEMSLAGRRPPQFFRSRDEINTAGDRVPQAHALRRAFDSLDLDGILCLRNTPFLYFKEVARIDPEEVWNLHRRFWNQGLAPVLLLITPRQVHVYSGLAAPPKPGEDVRSDNRLVVTLDRIADAAELRQLVLSLESGEFFHRHSKWFDPERRVDRDLLKNLEATREQLDEVSDETITARVLDALLCRVVFTCYLFDRKVIGAAYLQNIGIRGVENLRDILSRSAKDEARTLLFLLFERLGTHFNGDLFNDDLDAERDKISHDHLTILDRFIRGADVRTGQGSFWPYDFSVIPIETISAIYEHFLKSDGPEEQKETGAFYTPRFLAEIVLDLALEGCGTLLDKRFLDPACGSGIFLVGLFNRLAEEWLRKNPDARYDTRASGLMGILRDNLYGVDRNPTACRIAAFSLYLALLDQLRPSDIQELQRKGKVLPPLIYDPEESSATRERKTIVRADFFTEEAGVPHDAFHVVVGNPPWASVSGPKVPAETWFEQAYPDLPLADRQLARAFVMKGPQHAVTSGRICFVLPHGVLFNRQGKAVTFQHGWLKRHAVDSVLNLADFQRFLFEAENPAVVARYRKEPPANGRERIEYLAPKTDWGVSKAAVISIVPEDMSEFQLREVLASLRDADRPVAWKERYWGTPRDSKFLDRLFLLPRLRAVVAQKKDKEAKRWFVAQGFQPMGKSDDPEDAKEIILPSKLFINAKTADLNLFSLESDCNELPSERITVRRKMNTVIFEAPHVLVSQGMRVAFAGFDASFQDAIQGIHGPAEDENLLAFLAAYLRSSLARYFLFHATAHWGVERSRVHLHQLLTVPFPLPEQTVNPGRSREIVAEVAAKIRAAAAEAASLVRGAGVPTDLLGEPEKRETRRRRARMVEVAQKAINDLVLEYFDVDPVERVLIEDTNSIIIPSTRPSHASERLPTLKPSSPAKRLEYKELLCHMLNDWADGGPYRISGHIETSPKTGLGIIVLERHDAESDPPQRRSEKTTELIPILSRLQSALRRDLGSVEMLRGLKVFDRNELYLIKPLAQRFWTKTAALNDADDIAATILMQHIRETH